MASETPATAGEVKKIKVHYRLATLDSQEDNPPSLQERLSRVMASALGADARERILPMADEEQHQGCLNFCKSEAAFFVADIMHLDGRTKLPRWIHPTEPRPYADVVPKDVAEGEASLGEPVYMMVAGNHVAAIERLGFRNTNLARYLNQLLEKGGELEPGTTWKLAPKVQVLGEGWKGGGVKHVVVKPNAAVLGYAPSQMPDDGKRRKASAAVRALDYLVGRGQQVVDALTAFGADEAKIEVLRSAMSADLMIKAKLELSIATVRRKTTAEVPREVIEQALAGLSEDAEVTIESSDGKSNGKLAQLVENKEVLEVNGLIEWSRAINALSSALQGWAAKGLIEMAP